MRATGPIVKDLVLVGGGHTHALVLRMLAMEPLTGLRVTLISDASHAPYSGMLPGFIGGTYDYDLAHIDLRRLCEAAGARFVLADAEGLDHKQKLVYMAGRPPLGYDVLSLNIGSAPERQSVPGAARFAIPSKPVPELIAGWERLLARHKETQNQVITIVGAGAGGVELALSIRARLGAAAKVTVLEKGAQALSGFNARARSLLLDALASAGIELLCDAPVAAVEEASVVLGSGRRLPHTALFWVTRPAPRAWLATSGLTLAADGFVATLPTLQTATSPAIFAAGDTATVVGAPRPKSGVFAVRQAHPLMTNIRRFLRGETLREFTPQKNYLSLVSTGDGRAVAVRGGFAASGKLWWSLKNRIDRAFMRKFSDLDTLGCVRQFGWPTGHRSPTIRGRSAAAKNPHLAPLNSGFSQPRGGRGWPTLDAQSANRIAGHNLVPNDHVLTVVGNDPLSKASRDLAGRTATRCHGCAAKVGPEILAAALARARATVLNPAERDPGDAARRGVLLGLASPDDAAAIAVPDGRILVQSLDYVTPIVSDPYTFGRIAATHALSDLFATGAAPHSALVLINVPLAAPRAMEEDVYQMLAGVLAALHADGAVLLGGHTAQALDCGLALTVNGLATHATLLRKSELAPGDALILTKPLGTGVLFAAAMRLLAKGRWLDAAIDSMLISNAAAAEILGRFGARGVTDVTGFGLAGHLTEMVSAAGVSAALFDAAIPTLQGARELLAAGVRSSLHDANTYAAPALATTHPLLFDPQTSGGLLAGVPAAAAPAIVAALNQAGLSAAAVIGHVTERKGLPWIAIS